MSAGWFPFEGLVAPVPDSPTHCRDAVATSCSSRCGDTAGCVASASRVAA